MIMTVVAIIFLPLVLAYQAWTYWVFRKRVIAPGIPAAVDAKDTAAGPGPGHGAAARGSNGHRASSAHGGRAKTASRAAAGRGRHHESQGW
jgi:hypothetical protein